MPGKKRYYPRRRRQPTTDNRQQDESNLNAAARQLLSAHSSDELKMMLEQAEAEYAFADREAQEQPGPMALRRYRAASTALEEAQRAFDLSLKAYAS